MHNIAYSVFYFFQNGFVNCYSILFALQSLLISNFTCFTYFYLPLLSATFVFSLEHGETWLSNTLAHNICLLVFFLTIRYFWNVGWINVGYFFLMYALSLIFQDLFPLFMRISLQITYLYFPPQRGVGLGTKNWYLILPETLLPKRLSCYSSAHFSNRNRETN